MTYHSKKQELKDDFEKLKNRVTILEEWVQRFVEINRNGEKVNIIEWYEEKKK